jgi:hypothetical protein
MNNRNNNDDENKNNDGNKNHDKYESRRSRRISSSAASNKFPKDFFK